MTQSMAISTALADLSNKWGTENVLPMIIIGLKKEHREILPYASAILFP